MRMTPQSTDPVDDLDWLFGCAESAMGIRSSFGAMIDVLKIGHQDMREGEGSRFSAAHVERHHEETAIGCGRGPVQLSRTAATRRSRRVLSAFGTLTGAQKMVLEAWFYPRQWPKAVTSYFGKGAALVRLCPSGGELSVEQLTKLAETDSPRAQHIREEANELFADAVRAYSHGRL